MDLTEQQRLSADALPRENGRLTNGDASTSGRSHAASEPAADVFFEAEVMNRTEHSIQVMCIIDTASCALPRSKNSMSLSVGHDCRSGWL